MDDAIDEIRSDVTSGALKITLKAAEALKGSISSITYETITELVDHILKVSREIYRAKPSMASLANLAGYTLGGVEMGANPEEGVANALSNIDAFIALMGNNTSLVGDHAASIIEDGSSILTISHSSTVARAAFSAHRQGKALKVCCLESRPLMEGATLAKELAEAGIETVLMADAAAFMFMDEVNMIMVGGDSLSPQGLVNKTGTSGLAVAAEKQGIPFYALCSSEKIIPVGLHYQPKLDRYNPEQILKGPPSNLQVVNCYFDATPLDRLSGVITERGLIQGDYIMEHLSSLPIRRHLLEILQP